MLRLRQITRRLIDSAQGWRVAIVLGLATALLIWSIWYFTKVPCLPDNAVQGFCNPGILARFINAEILTLAGGGGIAVGALKGGYDNYMLKNMITQEREARLQSEQQLHELIGNLRSELQEERQQAAEEKDTTETETAEAAEAAAEPAADTAPELAPAAAQAAPSPSAEQTAEAGEDGGDE